MRRSTAIGRLAIWSVFLALALKLLHGSTLGSLSIPLGSVDELRVWADRTSPAVAALSLVRLGALAAAWYLAAATVLMVVADVAGWHRLGRAISAASPALVQRLATRSASAGLAAGALLGGLPLPTPLDTGQPVLPSNGLATRVPSAEALAAARAVPGSAATATMTRLPHRTAAGAEAAPDAQVAAGEPTPLATATMTRLPGGAGSSADARRSAGTPTPAPPPPPATPAAVPADDEDEWVVELGDSFWSIAEDALTGATPGRAPTEAEVAGYWTRLIDANRDRLADPGNPDLLLPGQHLVVPHPA